MKKCPCLTYTHGQMDAAEISGESEQGLLMQVSGSVKGL